MAEDGELFEGVGDAVALLVGGEGVELVYVGLRRCDGVVRHGARVGRLGFFG